MTSTFQIVKFRWGTPSSYGSSSSDSDSLPSGSPNPLDTKTNRVATAAVPSPPPLALRPLAPPLPPLPAAAAYSPLRTVNASVAELARVGLVLLSPIPPPMPPLPNLDTLVPHDQKVVQVAQATSKRKARVVPSTGSGPKGLALLQKQFKTDKNIQLLIQHFPPRHALEYLSAFVKLQAGIKDPGCWKKVLEAFKLIPDGQKGPFLILALPIMVSSLLKERTEIFGIKETQVDELFCKLVQYYLKDRGKFDTCLTQWEILYDPFLPYPQREEFATSIHHLFDLKKPGSWQDLSHLLCVVYRSQKQKFVNILGTIANDTLLGQITFLKDLNQVVAAKKSAFKRMKLNPTNFIPPKTQVKTTDLQKVQGTISDLLLAANSIE